VSPPDRVQLPHHTHRRIDLCGNPKTRTNRAPIPSSLLYLLYASLSIPLEPCNLVCGYVIQVMLQPC
jgi:hypothetical protein